MHNDVDVGGILTALAILSLLFVVPVVVFRYDARRDAARPKENEAPSAPAATRHDEARQRSVAGTSHLRPPATRAGDYCDQYR